jgi:hypothetical protein
MDDFSDPRPTPRRTRMVRSGLLGLAAAGLVGAVALAAGSGILPSGTFAADTTASQAPAAPQGPGPGDMDGGHGGRMGGIGRDITVTAINGSNVSLATADGWTRTIAVSSDTTIQKAGATISLSDVALGDEVRFSQTRQSDGTYHIDSLVVVLPHLGGQVTAIDGSKLTVTLPDGSTATITVASGATIEVAGTTATLADIKVGMVVMAEGTKTSDTALTASSVRAFDPANGPMGGGHHGHGPMGDMDGDGPGGTAPDASVAPSSNG